MGEAPDIQAIGRKGFEEKRQKRSAFKRRRDAMRAKRPQTGVFVTDPMARTGFTQVRRETQPKDIERLRELEARKRRPPTQKEIRDVAELEKKEYKNMKVTELRDELRERGLKVSGTKKELIKRLS